MDEVANASYRSNDICDYSIEFCSDLTRADIVQVIIIIITTIYMAQ